MSSLQLLKARIKSVKSTQKITKAMQLISASRLNKARDNLSNAVQYNREMQNMVYKIAKDVNLPTTILTQENTDAKKHLLIAISSDRGLCGSFNSSIIKKVKELAIQYMNDQKKFHILCIGKKVYDGLLNYHEKGILELEPTVKEIDINYNNCISDRILVGLLSKEYISLNIIYNKFVSAIKNETIVERVFPIDLDVIPITLAYEPKLENIIDVLLKSYLRSRVHNALLENAASEHSARMSAMDNATRNAKEMLKKLSNKYNRSRQATITNELIEIISGAEAL